MSSGDPATTGEGFAGQAGLEASTSEFNKQAFLVLQLLGLISTATLVRVESVTNSGGVSAVGFVDVLPLVNQVDGLGNSTPHVTVHNLPYFRLQGGRNAVIVDPVVGDVGLAVFADRDLSAVKATRGNKSNPGSRRRFSMADGLYVGGFLNGTPQNFVQFESSGQINVHSASKLTLDANGTGFVIDGSSGTITTYSNHGASSPSTPPQVPT